MPDNDITWSRIPQKAAERWALVRQICAGGDQEALGKYLPALNRFDRSAENVERNHAYKERAVLYNATGRTRDGLLGLAFRRDPKGIDEIPARLEYLADDCDGAGVSLYQQSQATLKAILETGRHGLYVDFSDALKGPIVKAYRAEDIINWRTMLVDGKTILTLVVLSEEAEQDDGYAVKAIPQWRELLLENGMFVCRVWQQPNAKGDPVQIGPDIFPGSAGGRLDFIPFVCVGAQNNDTSIDEAPLYDLGYLNRAHYRNSADYEDSVFLVGQPQPWISGLSEDWRDWLQKEGRTYSGSRAAMLLPEKGAYGFAQAAPNSLAKEAMDQKEAQMIAIGARLIEATRANRTATESDNDKEAATSVLSMCCANVSEAYTEAIRWCGRYLDLDVGDFGYQINQDFSRMVAEPQIISAIVAAWQSGAFAKVDARSFLRRVGIISVERTDEDIDSDLSIEGPQLGAMGEPLPGGVGVDGRSFQIEQQGKDEKAPLPGKAEAAAPAAPAAPDFAPLLSSIEKLIAKEPPAPSPAADFAPLLEAIEALIAKEQPAPVINVNSPITVNVPEQPAPIVNIAPAAITVEGTTITNTPPAVTVEGPTINVAPPQLIQARATDVDFRFDDDGAITGAKVN